ncbi:MAG: radical SAM protein [Polyangiaceae bacterium]|nr:radical SAM protein [Polyangiaceae bacterium]
MANIGYIQVVRHCNHLCGFCSNPTTPYTHTFETMKVLVDDLVDRDYFGVILTGGEPTLHPELPRICRYARERGLHVRMITNGTRLADGAFARELADAGLQLVHVSIYSVRPEVEAQLRGSEGTLARALGAMDAAHAAGIEVNVNCVINKLNAAHLDENVEHYLEHHPYVRHFVWNNLDPSMGRAEVNQAQFTPRLIDFEASLHRALSLLQASGRTFRVEKVPLCYMVDFAWASTETRKIVKGEERVVHFLDAKQTVRQTDWEHIYSEACEACTLRTICGGLFDRGNGYDPRELYPVFVSRDTIVRAILEDPHDPSFRYRSLTEWQEDFDRRCHETLAGAHATRPAPHEPDERPQGERLVSVGVVTEQSRRKFEAKREAEARRARALGIAMERDVEPTEPEPPGG